MEPTPILLLPRTFSHDCGPLESHGGHGCLECRWLLPRVPCSPRHLHHVRFCYFASCLQESPALTLKRLESKITYYCFDTVAGNSLHLIISFSLNWHDSELLPQTMTFMCKANETRTRQSRFKVWYGSDQVYHSEICQILEFCQFNKINIPRIQQLLHRSLSRISYLTILWNWLLENF